MALEVIRSIQGLRRNHKPTEITSGDRCRLLLPTAAIRLPNSTSSSVSSMQADSPEFKNIGIIMAFVPFRQDAPNINQPLEMKKTIIAKVRKMSKRRQVYSKALPTLAKSRNTIIMATPMRKIMRWRMIPPWPKYTRTAYHLLVQLNLPP